jgi:PAS domain S-box-containing protein
MATILVIDDKIDNLIAINAIISDAFPNVEVITSTSGEEGVKLAISGEPDVILLDIVMPGMDGFEVCRQIKGIKSLDNIPVVFVTALKESRENRIRALNAGAEAFLSKPIDDTELTAQIRAMLKIREANINKRDEKLRLESLVAKRTENLERELRERIAAEILLRKSEERFRLLIEQMEQGLAVHEIILNDTGVPVDYRFLDINPGFEKHTGLKRENLIGRTVLEVLPNTERYWIERYGEVALTGTPATFDEFSRELNRYYSVVAYRPQKNQFATVITDITEYKLAEKKLLTSDKIYNHVLDMICVAGFDGYFRDLNPSWERELGWSKEELLSKPWLHFVHPDDKERTESVRSTIIDGKELYMFENRYICKDGSIKWLSWNSYPYPKENIMFGVARDVTESKVAAEELIKRESLLNQIFDVLPIGLWFADKDGKLLRGNPAGVKIWGAEPSVLPDDYGIFKARRLPSGEEITADDWALARTISTGEVIKDEMIEIKAFDGKKRVILNYTVPIIDGEGTIQGAIVMNNDITDRKRDEDIQQILYEITKYSIVAKSLEELLVVVRRELSKILETKNFFVALYNKEKNVLRKVFFEDEKDDFTEWDADKSLSGYVVKRGTTILLNREEIVQFARENQVSLLGTLSECWLGVPLKSNNECVGVIVVQSYEDSTAYDSRNARMIEMIAHELSVVLERTNMIRNLIISKERAEESDRLKSAFLANMSHEIRTPMNGIMGFLQLLNDIELSGEDRQYYFDIINKSGDRLLSTINDIIEISKIESGQLPVHKSRVNIEEIIRYHYEFFRKQTDEKGLKLIVNEQVKGEDAFIISDHHIIDGILTNLIKNAVKFTDNGYIEFGNLLRDDKLVFYVKDSGSGIPPDRVDSIFERFVQADLDYTRPHEGSGLGLSIVKAYISLLNGDIWLDSVLGEGSTFWFSIPYIPAQYDSPELENSSSTVPQNNSRIQILIVEDDLLCSKYLETIIIKEGLGVIHAKNGEEAVRLMEADPKISMILMDLRMPVMDGLEATKKIREFNKSVIIVAQTVNALPVDRKIALNAGCNDYLSKPIIEETLKSMLNKYLSIKP